ncbi:MAG: hypothetical protein KDD25_07275 [Bdellovibrionales bacterium]|nr:hypothetical protein [Bdellovibrionales bacterium]
MKNENLFRILSLFLFGFFATAGVILIKQKSEGPKQVESLLEDLEAVEQAHLINNGGLPHFSLRNQRVNSPDASSEELQKVHSETSPIELPETGK